MQTLLHKKQLIYFIIVLCCFLTLTGCGGGQVPNMQTVLINVSRSYPNIWRLVTSTCYLLGFLTIIKALYHLKIYGESRTMMSGQTSLKTPLTWLTVGAALMFTPTIFQVFMWSTFGTTNISPLAYTIKGWNTESLDALIGLIRLIGLFSFVRGLLFISKAGDQHAQQGMFGKGLTHIIGGLFAINIVGTITLIQNTFFGA